MTGIIGLVFFAIFGFILGVVAIITGAFGVKECNRGSHQGKGMAVAGIVMGAISLLWLPFFMLMFFSAF